MGNEAVNGGRTNADRDMKTFSILREFIGNRFVPPPKLLVSRSYGLRLAPTQKIQEICRSQLLLAMTTCRKLSR
jgi:hypothetical protein